MPSSGVLGAHAFAPGANSAIGRSRGDGQLFQPQKSGCPNGNGADRRADRLITTILSGHEPDREDLLEGKPLAAAVTSVKSKPVVFTEVYDPIAAGAGISFENHVSHITGVGSFPPLEAMLGTMQSLIPTMDSVGVVYNRSEPNSRKVMSAARNLVAKKGIRLEETTVTNTSEVLQAAQVLAQRDVELLWEIGDNTVNKEWKG